ncbi:MAG: hypothetical protein KGJ89_03185 [Patescibacteria group bacterium]|nr:hypothetical protein [Patescibacteria group bacterium]
MPVRLQFAKGFLCLFLLQKQPCLPSFKEILLNGAIYKGIGQAIQAVMQTAEAETQCVDVHFAVGPPRFLEMRYFCLQVSAFFVRESKRTERSQHFLFNRFFANTRGSAGSTLAAVVHVILVLLSDGRVAAPPTFQETAEKELVPPCPGDPDPVY